MTACTRSTRQTAASDTPASSTQAPAPAGSSAAPNQSAANRKEPRKMFICTGYGTCTMAFSRSEHLARHIRKHTGERPFQCHCGRNFSRLDNLRQHAQSIHSHQPELNHSMMVRLSAVHNQLSSQTPNKKRRSIAGPSVSGNSSPSGSTSVLPPSPTHTVDYASQQSPPSPAALQYSSVAGEPPHRYTDYIATPTPSPYTSQPAYTFSAEDTDGYNLGSMSSSVPRRMPNDSLYAQSSFASYYPGQQLYHNENTHQIHPRPASYHGSPSPLAVPSLFDTEGMASFTTSFMQHYSQLSVDVDGPFHPPGSDMTPRHLLYSRSLINGSSEDTDLPSLTVSNDGRSSSYPSPSTPSPTQTSFSAPPTASVGGLADMFTHDLLGPSVQDDDYLTQHSASTIRYPSRSCSATPLTYSQGSISPSLVEPYSGPSSSTACHSKKRAFKEEAL